MTRAVLCTLFVVVIATRGSLDGGVAVDYVPLDGDALYEFSWAGPSKAARAEDVTLRGADADSVPLPNELLGSGYTDEVVAMATQQQEKYTCVLPNSNTDQDKEDGELDSKYLTPQSLLQPLQYQCLILGQGYWSYELCHGQTLRQYHEENTGTGVKVDKYYLGRVQKLWQPDVGDTGNEGDGESGKTEDEHENIIPTWHFNGFDYPYYEVKMTGGTPCDLHGDNPRSVSILYICQTDAQVYGTLLLVEESTSCHYIAVVGTKQLCQNKAYRLKEQPVYTISCYSEQGSPKKPGILREQEFDIINTTPKPAPPPPSATTTREDSSQLSEDRAPPGPSLDETIIMTFLTGEMCLRGGSGWWIHELCLMKQVKQIHQESYSSEIQTILGVWNEDLHKEWYKKEGHKKVTKTSVTHIYQDGDMCDITGKPRHCFVKFKCAKTKSASQISIYLTEQSVCAYTMTVEGQFICSLLNELDDHGLFRVRESSKLFEEQIPPPQADSDANTASQSQSGSKSGESQVVEEGSEIGEESAPSQTDHEDSKHSKTHSGSTKTA